MLMRGGDSMSKYDDLSLREIMALPEFKDQNNWSLICEVKENGEIIPGPTETPIWAEPGATGPSLTDEELEALGLPKGTTLRPVVTFPMPKK